MKKYYVFASLFLLAALLVNSLSAQEKGYIFTDKIDIDVTSVKDQHRSGTCWSFAAISYLEAELLRVGAGTYDLSEMFLVRHCYADKADKFVRMHGKTNFGPGGLAHDLIYVWKNYGLVPEEAYSGMVIGEEGHVHGEMDAVFSGYVEAVIKNRNRKLTPAWKLGFDGMLDAYLGEYPESFSYKGMEYGPESFAASLELNPDDYITIGSFTHHPYYEPFILEIPDNWGWNTIENVTMEELMMVLDNALEMGYSVCWDADVGERGFDWNNGVALIPSERIEDLAGSERGRWSELSAREKQALFYDFSKPKKEVAVDQEMRQEGFDNYQTTDDHLMHITGTAVDQDGKKFYKVKNSWGVEDHIYEGYFYASEAYMQAKTIFFMVHKDAVPKDIAKKLGL
jgi:bleomycin hydrolase